MKRTYVALLLFFSLFTGSFCLAVDINDFIFTDKKFNFNKGHVFSNGLTLNIYSINQIDLPALLSNLAEIDQSGQSLEKIKSLIEEKRQNLFPDEEIILLFTNQTYRSTLSASASGIKQVAQITWWNNYNSYNSHWAAWYYCHAADMFTYIRTGSYHLYTYIDEDSYWYYLFSKSQNTVGTWSKPQNMNLKGYAGIGASSSNSADVVMNFYDAY